MVNFLSQDMFIYAYNDMSAYLVQGMGLKHSINYFPIFNSHNFISNIDFINSVINYFLFIFFNPLLVMYILGLVYLLISFFISFKLFFKLNKNIVWSIIFSSLYSFSIFYVYRIVSFTPNLYQVFFFPLLVFILYQKNIKPIKLGLLLFLFFSFSSYYAFFSSLVVLFWFLSEVFINQSSYKIKTWNFCKKSILVFVPLFVLLIIVYSPLLLKNLTFITATNNTNEIRYRTIEEYYSFTFRPWYFLIPPQSSVFFGEFSKNTYNRLEKTGYYLADDYSEREMGGSYMGWHFILGTIFILLLLVFAKSKRYSLFFINSFKNKDIIIKSFIIIFCLLLISQPPSFTISGVTIYTPSYILYHIVPAFRALVRLSVVIYLFVLIINYFLILDLYQIAKSKMQKFVFIITFCLLNFIIFAVSVPTVNFNSPSSEMSFLKNLTDKSIVYAVYPNGDYYSIFWMLYHKHKMINPVNFVNTSNGFKSNEFSESLNTVKGIEKLKNLNVNYLILYKNRVQLQQVKSLDTFFLKNLGNKVFENSNSVIYKVEY